MWSFIKTLKYEIKSPMFCLSLFGRLGALPLLPQAQAHVTSSCSFHRALGDESLRIEYSFCVIEAGNFHSFEEFGIYNKKTLAISRGKTCSALSKGELRDGILEQGNIKRVWSRALCSYFSCPNSNLPVRCNVVS